MRGNVKEDLLWGETLHEDDRAEQKKNHAFL